MAFFLPPPKPRLHELLIMKEAKKKGIPVIPGRGSVLTQPLAKNPDRGMCFNCGQCNRACKVYGDFSSSSCLVIPAIRTGNLEVLPNSLVREVLVDDDGLDVAVFFDCLEGVTGGRHAGEDDAERIVEALGRGVQPFDEFLQDSALVVDDEDSADRLAHVYTLVHESARAAG